MNLTCDDQGNFTEVPSQSDTREFGITRRRFNALSQSVETVREIAKAFDIDTNDDGSLVLLDEGGMTIAAFAPGTWMDAIEVPR